MSIERALVAIEAIAAALTIIAANTVASPTVMQRDSQVSAGEAQLDAGSKTSGSTTEPKKRSRPSKEEIAKATGIKVEDQETAVIVAKALVGDKAPAPEADTAPAADVMDYEVLKRAVLEVGSYSEAGRSAVISLLGDYGVKNAKDLPPELREEFHGILLGILTDLQNAEVSSEDEFA